jgi:hypothetical protein
MMHNISNCRYDVQQWFKAGHIYDGGSISSMNVHTHEHDDGSYMHACLCLLRTRTTVFVRPLKIAPCMCYLGLNSKLTF